MVPALVNEILRSKPLIFGDHFINPHEYGVGAPPFAIAKNPV